ncbi:GDYXXLXY domain-containing protein [Bosea caraganae]|nr:GDYXXLXY domain-containing protein [Bosea caraganae]
MMRIPSADLVIARVPVLVRAILAMLVLCGAIGLLVQSRASILSSGAEIRLKTEPVDPRDLFRGDYVVLNYEISRFDLVGTEGDRVFKRGETIYVRLAPNAEGFARVVAAYKARPDVKAPEAVIAGTVRSEGACPNDAQNTLQCDRGRTGLRVAYGLESYFVPQGEGLAIEHTERSRIEVVAAVAASGQAAIKRLLIDGKPVYEEPPY